MTTRLRRRALDQRPVSRDSSRNSELRGRGAAWHAACIEGRMPIALERFAAVLFWSSAGYLGWRLLCLWVRVHRSRHAYPRLAADTRARDPRIHGALLGLATGDALGLPAEHLPAWLVRLRYPGGPRLRAGRLRMFRRAGDVSDDTQLSIAVARSIMPDGGYCHERFKDELRAWYAYRVGAGRATTHAARRLWDDRSCAPAPLESAGNGVAIRVAPLGLVLANDDDLLDAVELNGRETHGALAIAAAKLIALFVHRAQRFAPGGLPRGNQYHGFVEALALRAGFPLDRYRAALSGRSLRQRLELCGTGPHVLESVTAVLLVLHTHPVDFRAAQSAVFAAGGDTDSIGSMVGAILGANLGSDGLVAEWTRVAPAAYLGWLSCKLSHSSAAARGGVIRCLTGDIAEQRCDAIVNPWNQNAIPTWLLLPQGVSRALRRAGGARAFGQLNEHPPLPLGGAWETSGFALAARWVIHVAGIDHLWRASVTSIRESTEAALRLAAWLGARSVAVPLIGAGSGGFSATRAEAIIREVCREWTESFDDIRIVRRRPAPGIAESRPPEPTRTTAPE